MASTTKTHLTIKAAAAYLHVSPETLKNWESAGRLLFEVERTGGGHRRYPLEGLEQQAAYIRKHGRPPASGQAQQATGEVKEDAALRARFPGMRLTPIHARMYQAELRREDVSDELDRLLGENEELLLHLYAERALRESFLISGLASIACLGLLILVVSAYLLPDHGYSIMAGVFVFLLVAASSLAHCSTAFPLHWIRALVSRKRILEAYAHPSQLPFLLSESRDVWPSPSNPIVSRAQALLHERGELNEAISADHKIIYGILAEAHPPAR